MQLPSEKAHKFARYLESLAAAENRAALAALRRGLGKPPGTVTEMFPYIEPWSPGDAPWHAEPYYLVASLFAWHPRSWPEGGDRARPTNLGASFALLARRSEAPAEQADGGAVERRFVALLNSHGEDLHVHLRQAIGLLKSHEIPVDWAQLLQDVLAWDRGSRSVQRAWARAFWGTVSEVPEVATEVANR